jgi:hypothetical protein
MDAIQSPFFDSPTYTVYHNLKSTSMGSSEVLWFTQLLHIKVCVKCGLEKCSKVHYNKVTKQEG